MQKEKVVHADIPFPESQMEEVVRTTHPPYQYICRLESSFHNASTSGTGTLIGDRYVLTAAHNLLNDTYGKATEVRVTPGQTGGHLPFGQQMADAFFYTEEYATHPAPYPAGDGVIDYTRFIYDYAVIRLPKPFFRENPLGPYVASFRELDRKPGLIIGYPGCKPAGTMWEARHPIQANADQEELLFYRISTCPGDSGAGVLCDVNEQLRIIGVHVAGSEFLQSNFGVRINDEVYSNIRKWIS
ncbi:MAG: trypsin-like serine protease [Chitinophagaceae bacterium]|nr:trypsin-like serine protease [Chitinophagaceae bacterium]